MPFRIEALEQLLEVEVDGKRLTQRRLGDEVGVPQATIFRWLHKTSRPNMGHLDDLYRVALKYGVDAEFYVKPELE